MPVVDRHRTRIPRRAAIGTEVASRNARPLRTDPAIRPPLKWAGGKRWLLPHVVPLWRAHEDRRLVEPFCGGLAITLGLAPRQALLNDVSPHLINFYRWLKRGLTIDRPMRNSADDFYACRDRFNERLESGGTESREAAELFYYLNRTGYNGLCRFNRRGRFNVPFGRYRQINYRTDLTIYRKLFGSWIFRKGDFETIRLRPDDFVYADPPYDVPFTHYSKQGFDWASQERAARWLARHPGPVVLSNQATPRILDLYASLGFALRILAAPRRISCTGNRTPAREVLALRNCDVIVGPGSEGPLSRDPPA